MREGGRRRCSCCGLSEANRRVGRGGLGTLSVADAEVERTQKGGVLPRGEKGRPGAQHALGVPKAAEDVETRAAVATKSCPCELWKIPDDGDCQAQGSQPEGAEYGLTPLMQANISGADAERGPAERGGIKAARGDEVEGLSRRLEGEGVT